MCVDKKRNIRKYKIYKRIKYINIFNCVTISNILNKKWGKQARGKKRRSNKI